MNVIKPLQISFNRQVLEQDQKFRFIASATMGFHLTKGESLLEIDFLKDGFTCMGSHILPDTGMPKPHGEYLVSGKFFSPSGDAVTSGEVQVNVNDKTKTLYVFGERLWNMGVPTEPVPFSELELNYAQAYGGGGYAKNPNGLGHLSDALPRIEIASQLVTSNNSDVAPASFAPLDPALPQRMQFQGTYDDDYLKKYFPGYPPDLDWRFFMVAPEDQWQQRYFRGDESFEITHMHPQKRRISGQLPNYYVRCFAEKKVGEQPVFHELTMHLDTVWFFPEEELGWLIFRGGMEVADDEANEISNILLAYERHGDDRRSQSHYESALEKRLNSDDTLLNNFNTRDLIARGDEPAMVILQERALEDHEPSEFAKNLDAKSEAMKELINEKLESAQGELSERMTTMETPSEAKDFDIEDLLSNSGSEPVADPDVELLNKKLEEILPGITSGDPKQIKLEEFSFDKIDKIMDEVNAVTQKKADIATQEIANAKSQMDAQIEKQIADMDDAEEQRDNIRRALDNLDESSENPPEHPLPRLDIEEVANSLDTFSQTMDNSGEQVQKMQELGMDEDQIQHYKDTLGTSSKDDNETVKKNLELAQQQFKDLYRGSAHFQGNGASPHKESVDNIKRRFLSDIAAGIAVADRDWACIDLSGESLAGIDLSNAYLEQVNFTGADLRGSNFSGAILARATLTEANFSGCDFRQANVGSVVAKNVNFTNANFDEAKLSRSDFNGSDFSHASLVDIESLELKIDYCRFVHAKMPNMKFIETDLNQVNFAEADLTSAAFLNSRVNDCDFSSAILVLTTWAETAIQRSTFNQANMTSNCFAATEPEAIPMKQLSFVGTVLDKSNFQFMKLPNTDFSRASMSNVNCNYADMHNSRFEGANLQQAQFRHSILNDANFHNANVMEGSLSKASLVRTNLSSANLFAVDFLRAIVKNTCFDNSNLDVTLLKDWRP